MSTTIYGVLDELRAQSTSESDKGTKFERLIAEYMRTDPMYRAVQRRLPVAGLAGARRQARHRHRHRRGRPADRQQRRRTVQVFRSALHRLEARHRLVPVGVGQGGLHPADHHLDHGPLEPPRGGLDPGPAGPRTAHRARRPRVLPHRLGRVRLGHARRTPGLDREEGAPGAPGQGRRRRHRRLPDP